MVVQVASPTANYATTIKLLAMDLVKSGEIMACITLLHAYNLIDHALLFYIITCAVVQDTIINTARVHTRTPR
jgi:hypothetical protein